MKKFFAVLFAALMLVCCFTACSKASSSETSSEASSEVSSETSSVSSYVVPTDDAKINEIKAAGVITMYTNAYFPPFEYYDGTEIKGVDVEIAQKIAEKLGVTLEIKDADFNSLVEAVNTGKADFAAAGMSITDERKESVNFSTEYVTTQQYVIVLEDDAKVTNFESLAGCKIGVQESTTGNIYVDDEISDGCLKDTGASAKLYANALLAAQDLKNAKVDAVVIDELTAKNIVSSNTGLKCFALNYADGTSTEEQYAIAVAKENTALLELINEVIAELAADGSIDSWIVSHTLNAAA